MGDLIDRQAALDAIREAENHAFNSFYKGLVKAHKIIADLSSADVVSVRRGKWKKIGVWGRVYKCNQCGNFLDFDGVNAGRGDANFCPKCGAKMDGKEW